MAWVCESCGYNFTGASNLRRHKRSVHAGNKTHVCKICDQDFTRSDHLTKHLKRIHNVVKAKNKPSKISVFWCKLCLKSYRLRKGLVAHIRKKHGGNENAYPNSEDEKEQEEGKPKDASMTRRQDETSHKISCDLCPSTFTVRSNLYKHVRKFHGVETDSSEVPNRGVVHNLVCPECDHVDISFKSLTTHLEESHHYESDSQIKTFKCMSDFETWRENVKAKTLGSYVNRRGVRELKGGKKIYLECHRGGFYRNCGKGLRFRKPETRTKKIDAACPSRMVVLVKADTEEVVVEWNGKHFGHEVVIQPLDERRLVEGDQEAVADVEIDEHSMFMECEVEPEDMWQPIAMDIKNLMDKYSGSPNVPDAVVKAGLQFLDTLRKEIPEPGGKSKEDEPGANTFAMSHL